jgi:hypothetical protein
MKKWNSDTAHYSVGQIFFTQIDKCLIPPKFACLLSKNTSDRNSKFVSQCEN